MIVIIALKSEELYKAGLHKSLYRSPLGATCHLHSRGGRGQRAGRAIERATYMERSVVRVTHRQVCCM